MHSMNACKIDGATQIMYKESHLKEAYPFQSTTQVSLRSFFIVLATVQRGLQGDYRGQAALPYLVCKHLFLTALSLDAIVRVV
jgi:hypothetical protein